MFKRLALTASAAAFAVVLVGADVEAAGAAETRAAVEEIAAEHEVPAVVLAIVRGDQATEFTAAGLQDRRTGEAVAANTLFQIASVSKVLTGIIATDLSMNGKLDLEAPVLSYLPDTLSAEARKKLAGVSVTDLLHHRSGLPRDTAVHRRSGNDPMTNPLTEEDLLKDLEIAAMVGEPGERFEYSNLGYGLMGYILERASGKSYADLVDSVIARPYGLDSTGTTVPEGAEARLATPYRKEDADIPTKPWKTGKLVAASGLYSTAADLAKLLSAQISAYGSTAKKGNELVLTKHTTPTGDGRQYGFGMNIQPIAVGEETVNLHFHSGDMDGFAAFYGFIPSRDEGFVLLVSRGGQGKEELQHYALRRALGLDAD